MNFHILILINLFCKTRKQRGWLDHVLRILDFYHILTVQSISISTRWMLKQRFVWHISGQFKDLRVRIQENTGSVTRGNKVKKTGTMTFPQFINRKSVRVFEGQRLNMASKQHTKCWYVRNNGRGLLEGKIQNYRVPNLLHHHLASGLARRFTI